MCFKTPGVGWLVGWISRCPTGGTGRDPMIRKTDINVKMTYMDICRGRSKNPCFSEKKKKHGSVKKWGVSPTELLPFKYSHFPLNHDYGRKSRGEINTHHMFFKVTTTRRKHLLWQSPAFFQIQLDVDIYIYMYIQHQKQHMEPVKLKPL